MSASSPDDAAHKAGTVRYPGKVLLFGEHAVLAGSRALAVPWPLRYATWAMEPSGIAEPKDGDGRGDQSRERAQKSAEELRKFVRWILSDAGAWSDWLDTEALERSFLQNPANGHALWLQSNIPEGYGLGSSGSVCAAVLDRFGRHAPELNEANIHGVRAFFGRMEGFFHARSSGVDPLVSYLGSRSSDSWLAFEGDKHVAVLKGGDAGGEGRRREGHPSVQFGEDEKGQWAGFDNAWTVRLIDTGLARQTAPLVQAFRERLQSDREFERLVRGELCAANAAAIDALCHPLAPGDALGRALLRISRFSLEHLDFLIPRSWRGPWGEALRQSGSGLGLEKEAAISGVFKLCGAGGGGYIQHWSRRVY